VQKRNVSVDAMLVSTNYGLILFIGTRLATDNPTVAAGAGIAFGALNLWLRDIVEKGQERHVNGLREKIRELEKEKEIAAKIKESQDKK